MSDQNRAGDGLSRDLTWGLDLSGDARGHIVLRDAEDLVLPK